jgi:hypothetical protein
MHVRPIDPRDTVWEIDSHSYRFYFWEPQPPPQPNLPVHPVSYHSSEFEVTDVDVAEVIAWAEATASPGSTYTLYAVIDQGNERGLIRLAGVDPLAPKRTDDASG